MMKISWIKSKNDNKSFNFYKKIGMEVYELNDLDNIDEMLNNLITNNYKTIILSSEVAGFSSDIITKYQKSDDINIFIMPNTR